MVKGLVTNELKVGDPYLDLSLKMSTLFFSMGYIFSAIDYILVKQHLLLWINVISLALLITLLLFYKKKIVSVSFAFLAHIVVITLNLYLGIMHEAALAANGSAMHVGECMCVCIIPAILSGMTHYRWLSIVIAVGANVCYAIAAISMGNPDRMLSRIPSFIIVTIGIAFALSYLLAVIRRIERENLRIEGEQKNILQLFDFTPKQLELIKEGRMSRERLNNLVLKMNKKSQDKMIYKLREMAYTHEEIKQAIRNEHTGLTAGDLELCAFIVKGRSSGEIASLRGIHHNSVTAHRSRLRTKLGLNKEQNLNDYLQSIVDRRER